MVVGGSHKPRDAKLSQDLIILLSIGGVPSSYFRKLLRDALDNIKNVLKDRKLAEKGMPAIVSLLIVGIPFYLFSNTAGSVKLILTFMNSRKNLWVLIWTHILMTVEFMQKWSIAHQITVWVTNYIE
jgi:hypothetical protein